MGPNRLLCSARSVVCLLVLFLAQPVLAQGDLEQMRRLNPRMPPPLELDAKRIEAQGITAVTGEHLTLYSDLRDEARCRDLVAAFDAAVPQWGSFFGIPGGQLRPWHLVGFLVQDRERFKAAGLWPEDLPEFPAGYNLGHHFWIFPQEGNYYTRHLLLHEGTHAFMQWYLGGSGPPWYSEGMAEWLALHRWSEGSLELKARIADRNQVDYWGRPKLIRKALEAGRRMRLDELFDFPNSAFRNVESYAWAWAGCEFLARHPLSAKSFAQLPKFAEDSSAAFSRDLKRKLKADWDRLELDWQQFVEELDYGILADRLAIRPVEETAQAAEGTFRLATAWGWQDSGIEVAAGEEKQIEARGRYMIRTGDPPWPCEAGGITIEYYRGRPLGELLVAVLPEDPKFNEVLVPLPIGTSRRLTFERAGRLLFRINESPVWLEDNTGELEIRVR
ncbi:MAG: hypothetical protein ACK56D_09945 [Planctomycetota bacterium]|nr:hypothetical protein [Blastopirellula sp.]